VYKISVIVVRLLSVNNQIMTSSSSIYDGQRHAQHQQQQPQHHHQQQHETTHRPAESSSTSTRGTTTTTPGHRPTSSLGEEDDYFQFHENDYSSEDFVMRFVDGTCQRMFPSSGRSAAATSTTNKKNGGASVMDPCHNILPVCQAKLEEQLDLWTVRVLSFSFGKNRNDSSKKS